ncbi:MAG: D-alanyl-D-alanine carboxypeptidase, partial [Vulcanimicrobiaceae bacterium]
MTRRANGGRAVALVIGLAIAFTVSIGLSAGAAGRAGPPETNVGAPPLASSSWTDSEVATLRGRIASIVAASPALESAHVGIFAVQSQTGRVLYARDAEVAFQPASTLKLLVGSLALERLGPDFRFTTRAVLAGPPEVPANGAYPGELVLVGGGDPFLSAADLSDVARAVAALGIRSLDDVYTDTSAIAATPYPDGWTHDDDPYDYAAIPSALDLEENVVHLRVTPGAKAGTAAVVSAMPAGTVAPASTPCSATEEVVVIDDAVTAAAESATSSADADDTLDLARARGGCIRVVGTIALGGAPQTLDAAVPDP